MLGETGAVGRCLLIYAKATMLSGLRGRNIRAIGFLAASLGMLVYLASLFSIRQPQTVALDMGFSGVRFCLILLGLFWVLELIGREVERKTVVQLFSLPRPRWTYLLGRYLGILALLWVSACVLGIVLLLVAKFSTRGGYVQDIPPNLGVLTWLTITGLWLECAVVVAVAVLIASISTSAMLPVLLAMLVGIGGRMIAPVLDYLERGAGGDIQLVSQYKPLLRVLQWLLPDLSSLDWRASALYRVPLDGAVVSASIGMALAYIVICLMLGAFLLSTRQFDN